MEFRKVLAKYYHKWHADCLKSIDYCKSIGQDNRAESYRLAAIEYAEVIHNNEKAIEFFSQGDNAFITDSALPAEFRGYK